MTALRLWLDRWWFALCILALMVATDFKVRVRANTDAIAGSADVFVLLELGIYALVGLYLLGFRARLPRPGRVTLPVGFTLLYLLVVVLSLGYTPYKAYSGVRVVEEFVIIGACLLAAAQGDRGIFHRLAHAFLVLMGCCVVLGVVHPLPPVSSLQEGRFTWLAVHPNISGVYFGIAVVIAATYLMWQQGAARPGPRWHWAWYAVLLLTVLGGLIATKTRAAVAGALIGVLIALWTSTRGRTRLEVSAVVAALLALLGLTSLGAIEAYLARGESSAQLATLNSRTRLWADAFAAIREQPIWGHGTGASRGLFLDALGLGGAHNAYLNVLVDVGAVGLFFWGGVIVTLALGLVRGRPTDRDPGVGLDRTIGLALLGFVVTDGIFVQGPGELANVAGTWLFVLVAWQAVLARRPDQQPVLAVAPMAHEQLFAVPMPDRPGGPPTQGLTTLRVEGFSLGGGESAAPAAVVPAQGPAPELPPLRKAPTLTVDATVVRQASGDVTRPAMPVSSALLLDLPPMESRDVVPPRLRRPAGPPPASAPTVRRRVLDGPAEEPDSPGAGVDDAGVAADEGRDRRGEPDPG